MKRIAAKIKNATYLLFLIFLQYHTCFLQQQSKYGIVKSKFILLY